MEPVRYIELNCLLFIQKTLSESTWISDKPAMNAISIEKGTHPPSVHEIEQGQRIRALHEIISRPDLTFDEQIDATLRLGCELLGTEIGKVGRQDPENNTSEFLNTIVLSDVPVKRGIVLPLDKTFCQITFRSPEAIAISHVKESEYNDHPAAKFLGVQSYIGCSINVHGKKFGTVNFSNRAPVAKPFTEMDKDLVNLIGSWISVMMERQFDAEELKLARDEAERANQAKSAFLANMSHEIRTPLTSIIGFTDAILDSDQSLEQREQALQIIKRSSDHLLHLINDVLDFSKIEAGELDIERSETNLSELLSDVESIVGGQAKQKGLDFSIKYQLPLPRFILSDPLRLKQILLNLCNNAVKFTPTGSVNVTLKYDRENRVLKFLVRDTGIGMTAEQAEQVFKPFKQADSSTTKQYGGTGLGLSLSRRLAELLGGDLLVSSEPGKGSIFILALTVPQSTDIELISDPNCYVSGITQTDSSMPLLHGNVLLADDSEMNQYLFRMYLEKMGATVTIADNGEMAVNLAKRKQYDLIYMDMLMPVLSGVDAVRALRKENYSLPIVMLTANATMEDRNLCRQVGSDDFLTKPIDRKKLYKVTARYLQKEK